MISDVEFESEGTIIRGRLFTPDMEGPTPAIAMGPGFSATSRFAVFEHYARAITEVGVAVLLFDYRGFGLSDGQPRRHINAWNQARDYQAAVRFLRDRDGIDATRVGLWGVSSSTAVVSVVAAVDPTLAAVVMVVPAFGDELSPPDPDASGFRAIQDTLLNADLDSFDTTVIGPLPIVSADQLNAPSFVETLTAFRWFIDSGGRFGTGWENQATLARLATAAPFDAQTCVPHIEAPTLMIIAEQDEESDADVAREVFATANENRQLLTIGGGHFEVLRPDSPECGLSTSAQQRFLQANLGT